MFELAFFNNDVTKASLYTSGKTPESNKLLIMVVMNGKMSSIKSRSNVFGTGSRLQVLGADFLIKFRTSASVTGKKALNTEALNNIILKTTIGMRNWQKQQSVCQKK